MTLRGVEVGQLRDELLANYSLDGLRSMLSMEMRIDLDRVASGSTRVEKVFNLIMWAEAEKRTAELKDAARRHPHRAPKVPRDYALDPPSMRKLSGIEVKALQKQIFDALTPDELRTMLDAEMGVDLDDIALDVQGISPAPALSILAKQSRAEQERAK
jgi:hypothetical protein